MLNHVFIGKVFLLVFLGHIQFFLKLGYLGFDTQDVVFKSFFDIIDFCHDVCFNSPQNKYADIWFLFFVYFAAIGACLRLRVAAFLFFTFEFRLCLLYLCLKPFVVQPYYMFIDTEANGMPDDYGTLTMRGEPLAMVQISWLIYNESRELVKKEDFYISNDDFEISEEAVQLHGIDRNKLNEWGRDRGEVLRIFNADLESYPALVVGHYVDFDLRLLQKEFEKAGLANLLIDRATCCTMRASALLVDYPFRKFYKLDELYALFFGNTARKWHNAAEDAEATAMCFYSMHDRGLIKKSMSLERREVNPVFSFLLWLGIGLFVAFIIYVSLF